MTRSQFLMALCLTPLATAQSILYSQKEEAAFVKSFNAWVVMGNHNGAIVDAKEIRAWHATVKAWKNLYDIVQKSY